METMKRAISAFMALVLVLGMLPGVPMSAGAEELETLPEVLVEETQAVTVPEETEAAETTEAAEETVPAETVEETVPEEETVPAETEEETIPEETVEETVPEETVEETVPEETVEDLTASEEAVEGVVLQKVTDIQVSANKSRTFVGDKVTLSAVVSPSNADIKTVAFYVVEDESDSIAYDEELLAAKGVLIAEEAGTLTIAARATDVDTPHDSITQEKGGKVKVTFVNYDMEINEVAIDKESWYDSDEGPVLRVMTGKKLELSVHYMINEEVQLPLEGTKPNVKWYLDEGEEKYATVTVNPENCQEVTVTGKTVTASKYITLYAKEETLGVVDSVRIAVYPVPYKVAIYDGEGREYTNEKLTVPLLASEIAELQAAGKDYLEIPLNALVWPLEAEEPMVWTCSDNLVQVVHPDKEGVETPEGQEPEKDTTTATLRIYLLEGNTTITITSKNYPDVKSKITIERKRLMEVTDLQFHQETERLSTLGEGLIAGQSFQLQVYDNRNPDAPVLLDSKTVRWSLSGEDQNFATVTEEGKLTAKKGIPTGQEVTVFCSIIGNENGGTLELPVLIRPLSTEVRILPGALAEGGIVEEDQILNGMTVAVDTAEGCAPFALEALVLPAEDIGASQKVTWKSSDSKIAAIDPDTNKIVWKKNGTVTITATAADGSGKKASVKLQFGAMVRAIRIIQDEGFFLRSGKSETFEVEFEPVKPTNTGLTWTLEGENDSKYASVSASSGKLTAKTVYEEHIVTLRATAKDGSGVYGETTVLIKPKQDGILTLKGYGSYVTAENDFVTKTTQIIPVGDSIDLEAFILGSADPEPAKWKSSNKNAVLSDTEGTSTTVEILGTGTFTITATSLNDSDKKATVTIKGVRMTDYIEWTHTHEQVGLACGKSLTLKAKAYDAEGKTPSVSKLEWSIEEGGEKYAKVSGGKVTAIAGTLTADDEPVDITVVVRATDNSGVEETWPITIYPAAQTVTIDPAEGVFANAPTTGTHTYLLETPGLETIQMSAKVWPANAMDAVTWKSSSKSIAEIDAETGEITVKKAGSVTITATAADGTGKKATYKLSILQIPSYAYFEGTAAIAGGKSLKLKPVLMDGNDKKISGKKLEWSVKAVEGMEDGTAYVSSISGGTLKTKKVTEPKFVEVVARTVEKLNDWETEFSVIVAICPAASAVTILDQDGYDIGKTLWVELNAGGVQLDAVTSNKAGEATYQGVTWKTSNKKIAEVDEFGYVTFHKAGTVTITATAADGTGVKDTVKITIAK